jgi:hypothetical protein
VGRGIFEYKPREDGEGGMAFVFVDDFLDLVQRKRPVLCLIYCYLRRKGGNTRNNKGKKKIKAGKSSEPIVFNKAWSLTGSCSFAGTF